MIRTSLLPLVAVLTIAACRRDHAIARVDSPASGSSLPTPAGGGTAPDTVPPHVTTTLLCARPAGGIAVSADSLAGLPARASLGDLVRACAASTADIYTIGGYQPAARVFPFSGAKLTAVQSKYEGSLHYDEPPDLWAVEGDSVRLADGQLLPRTAGELRKRYPRGIVTSDKGDDSDGVRIISCQFPGLEFILSYSAPTPSPSGRWPLSARAVADTSHIFSVEVFPGRTDPDSSCIAQSAT